MLCDQVSLLLLTELDLLQHTEALWIGTAWSMSSPDLMFYPHNVMFKDEWHPKCVIMLRKRWANMKSAYFFLNAGVKHLENTFFFSVKIIIINDDQPKTLITLKIWLSLSFGEFFSSWKKGEVGICLVAAKVIIQIMFFFIFSYVLIISLWKKNIW